MNNLIMKAILQVINLVLISVVVIII
ncbi:hypothetical protein DBO95_03495, partial [Yersinia pestis]